VKTLPFIALILAACAASPPAETPTPHAHHASADHRFKDAEAWSREFDDPSRDAWQKPDDVITLMEIAPAMVVADVGAGTGYFEARLARAVGDRGKVFALDAEGDMVAFMRKRFERDGVANVEPRVCPLDATGLEPASVDRVLIVDTWHHISDREAYAKHLASVLRSGGSVTIVDFTLESDKGPPPEHRVGPDTAIRELEAGGLTATLAPESLPDQYVVVGRK
jgi:SAM-dependent methyltransferase